MDDQRYTIAEFVRWNSPTLASGSNTTSTSISLSGPKSSRKMEPKSANRQIR